MKEQIYIITLLTPSGIKIEQYSTAEPLETFEAKMTAKYGTFINTKSELK